MKLINHTLQKSFEIWNGIIIGKNQGGIKFPQSKEISGQHFRIHFDGVNFQIEDLGSKNGTFLGETKIPGHKPVSISPEMPFHAGEYEFSLSEHNVTLPGDKAGDSKPWMRITFLVVALSVLFISWSSYELSRYLNEFVPAWVGWMASLTSLGALILCVSLLRNHWSWIQKIFLSTGLHLIITAGLFSYEVGHFKTEPISSTRLPLVFSRPMITYLENHGSLSQKYAITVAFDLARMKRVHQNFRTAGTELCAEGMRATDCWMQNIAKIHAMTPWSVPALGRATSVLNELDRDLPQDQALLENRFKNWVALGELLLTTLDVRWLESLRTNGGASTSEKKLLSLHLLENIKYFQFQLFTETDLLEAQLKQTPSPQTTQAFAAYNMLKQKIAWPSATFENELKEIRKALEELNR